MNDTELCYLPATEALRLFRTHKLSPVELLKAQIKRADQVEPIINAFTDTFYDDALKKAKAAEKRYMAPQGRIRKLEGLTVAVKDEMEVNGLPVGIQVVARSYDDKRVFQLAAALENAQPWLDCADRRPNL